MATPDGALRDLPDVVARVLDAFVAAAREAFGDDLVSVVLFGSAAEGALRATSDVNLIVILRAFDRARADAVRDAARVAHAAAGLRAMFLLREEVEQAAAAFAQKFADVRRRHRVLWGEDPFARLAVPRAALVARTNQVLLNLVLRLRAQYVIEERHGFPGTLRALGVWGPCRGRHLRVPALGRVIEERHGFPGTLRALGVWGPCRGRHLRVPALGRVIEERHGFPGTLRALGVWGPCRGRHLRVPPLGRVIEERHGFPGTLRALGVWGPCRGRHLRVPALGRVIEERHGFPGTLRA